MARGTRRWWGIAERGDTGRLEAFSDGVFAIAVTLLILEVRVETTGDESLAAALHHALPQIGAYAASFLQIGIMWANHHALFRLVDRIDQLVVLLNLLLLGCVSFLPLPTELVAEHTHGADARTAVLLYGGTLAANALFFNLLWLRVVRAGLLVPGTAPAFVRDVNVRYLIGLGAYVAATLLAFVSPPAAIVVTVVLALVFLLGPSPRSGLSET
jgi:uncharacterized membrane protein